MPKSWYVLMLLRVYALHLSAFTPCVHMCAAAKPCLFVCRCHAIRPVLLQALLGRLKLLQGKECMCLPLCLYSIYI